MNEASIKLIQELSDKLGVTAEHLWAVLVKQAYVSGVSSVFFISLFAVLIVIMLKVWFYVQKKYDIDEHSFQYLTFWVCFISFCIIALFSSSFHLGNAINAFANPEYWALKQIWK
jgi:hypothetical protein